MKVKNGFGFRGDPLFPYVVRKDALFHAASQHSSFTNPHLKLSEPTEALRVDGRGVDLYQPHLTGDRLN